MDVWVVYEESEVWWLKLFLRPGHRHCRLIAPQNGKWLSVDMRMGQLDVNYIDGWDASDNLPMAYKTEGKKIQRTKRKYTELAAPLDVLSCVSVIKRFLGIRAPLVITPYQLCKYIERKHNV